MKCRNSFLGNPVEMESTKMKPFNLIKNMAVRFSLLAIFVGGGLLWAQDSGLLSKQDLKSVINNAKNAQDHERLARHYDARAVDLEEESKAHQALAVQYKQNPKMHEDKHPMNAETAGHCQYFADDLHKAAQRARQIADDHRTMAKRAAK